VCVSACMPVCMCVCMHTYTHIYLRHACMHVHRYVCVFGGWGADVWWQICVCQYCMLWCRLLFLLFLNLSIKCMPLGLIWKRVLKDPTIIIIIVCCCCCWYLDKRKMVFYWEDRGACFMQKGWDQWKKFFRKSWRDALLWMPSPPRGLHQGNRSSQLKCVLKERK